MSETPKKPGRKPKAEQSESSQETPKKPSGMKEWSEFKQEYSETFSNKKNPDREMKLKRLVKEKDRLKEKFKDDEKIYKDILVFERARRLISARDEYWLNELEAKTADMECECHNAVASGRKVQLGDIIKCKKSFDEARGADIYTLFPTRTIEPHSQIPRELARKMRMGTVVTEEDYPAPKTLTHRFQLVEGEFFRHFRIVD